MTTSYGRWWPGDLPDDAGLVGESVESDPAPGSRHSLDVVRVAGLGQRARTAAHEAGHAVASTILRGEASVTAASIRPGRGHRGVTLLGEPPADRRESELDIIVTMAGDLAVTQAGLLEDGWHEDTPDEVAAVTATVSLERLSPLVRARLLEAEADEQGEADEPRSWRQAQRLDDHEWREAAAHLAYLTVVAEGFVSRHRHAIRAVAEALLAETTLDGATVAAIVHRTRCVCHAGWTTTAELAAQGLTPSDVLATTTPPEGG